MSSTRRKTHHSQESTLPQPVRRRRRHHKENHQSHDLTEASGLMSGASSFTTNNEEKAPRRRGLRPQPSTTSGMTFAMVSSQDEGDSSSSSSSSPSSSSCSSEALHDTLTSLTLSQALLQEQHVSTFEIDPPRPMAQIRNDQASVDDSLPGKTMEQKAWAGVEAVLRQSSNSVHREDVLSPDVLRALEEDSHATFHSRTATTVMTEPRPREVEEELLLLSASSPTRGLTGYLGRLTEASNNQMPSLMHSSFSSLQTDLQSAVTKTDASNDQEQIMQEFMDTVVALQDAGNVMDLFEWTLAQAGKEAETKDPPGEAKEMNESLVYNHSSQMDFVEKAHLSGEDLQSVEMQKTVNGAPNSKAALKAVRESNSRAQQMISPRQQRKLKKPLSSSLTQSKNGNPPASTRRTRSSSPTKSRGRSPTKIPEKIQDKRNESALKRRTKRDVKNASKHWGDYSQETLPIDFDASLPSGDPQNIVTRQSANPSLPKNGPHDRPQFTPLDEENPFFSPPQFKNPSSVATPKNRFHWPALLIVSPNEDKLNNSLPSLVTMNETELSQVEEAQARMWASFGDLGLDEMFRDEDVARLSSPTALPKRRVGRRRSRFHRANQTKPIPKKKVPTRPVEEAPAPIEEENGVETFVNYFRSEEEMSPLPSSGPVQHSSSLFPRFLLGPRKDRKKTIESIEKSGPLSKLKKGMGSLLCRNKRGFSTPNAARIDTGHRDAQFYPDMDDDKDESGYGNLLD
ncbi:hypothetical protein FisN_11Lh331 [Fistulifera solaris]|uniref:Uncharacterized protein n=1 Tax=Fistulifera solaris TaxID=1519565 RepID=A0A1Z5K0X5_FISSO|nr:hypothetical protein FisN_11Lh331 [Fistulifera solaris]|eukprot:GAX19809.1 hypothetical protein FisN_11Lh331 [Fistulifera solaris]